ncbi:hypothetical protein KFE25_007674 [Diacronema lutheri]|uniref:NADH-ubiquinone oxidoreductase 21kDa subunit N-terminal domain-containing protein n=1 Tax=Diacronema lutheri TaxID=2081491 RepID=A0A8J5XUD7_DIALT|nr:hypothetical protein KFE25_007674 [Diacronema lutheri]
MPSVYPPAYPVINRSPSVAAVVGNFTFSDVGLIVAPTLFAAAFGFWSGKPIRRPQMMFCAHLGFLAGALAAYNCSSARLMGYRANPKECARYDLEFPTKEQIPPHLWNVVDDKWYRKA